MMYTLYVSTHTFNPPHTHTQTDRQIEMKLSTFIDEACSYTHSHTLSHIYIKPWDRITTEQDDVGATTRRRRTSAQEDILCAYDSAAAVSSDSSGEWRRGKQLE